MGSELRGPPRAWTCALRQRLTFASRESHQRKDSLCKVTWRDWRQAPLSLQPPSVAQLLPREPRGCFHSHTHPRQGSQGQRSLARPPCPSLLRKLRSVKQPQASARNYSAEATLLAAHSTARDRLGSESTETADSAETALNTGARCSHREHCERESAPSKHTDSLAQASCL